MAHSAAIAIRGARRNLVGQVVHAVNLGKLVRDRPEGGVYGQLRSAIAARRRQLGLLQLEADEKSSLQPGYFGKIECGARKFGDLSLPMVLAALDADLYLAPRSDVDPVAEQRSLGPRDAGRFEHRHTGEPS